MHQIRFRLGLRPRPRWGAYSAPPDPLAGFGGPTAKEREREGGEGRRGEGRRGKRRGGRGGEGRKGKGRGREGKGHKPPHYLQEVYAYGAPLPPNPGYATEPCTRLLLFSLKSLLLSPGFCARWDTACLFTNQAENPGNVYTNVINW